MKDRVKESQGQSIVKAKAIRGQKTDDSGEGRLMTDVWMKQLEVINSTKTLRSLKAEWRKGYERGGKENRQKVEEQSLAEDKRGDCQTRRKTSGRNQ